jgi:hypothetical protein
VKSTLWCGTLQSPSDRKFKSVDAEILSVPTKDTYKKNRKNRRALQLSGMMQLYYFHRSVYRPGTVIWWDSPFNILSIILKIGTFSSCLTKGAGLSVYKVGSPSRQGHILVYTRKWSNMFLEPVHCKYVYCIYVHVSNHHGPWVYIYMFKYIYLDR